MSGENSGGRSERLNQVIADYLAAAQAGNARDRDEFLAQHPELADDLKSFFADHDQMKAVVDPPTLPPRGADADEETIPPGAPLESPTLPPGQLAADDATLPPDGQAPDAPPIGTTVRYFGDYELIDEIARGGMGVVFKAKQRSLNRVVALKMILAGQLASEEDVQRFYAEAEAAANLDHPGIVPIHEVGQHEGQHYFSMGFIEGTNLSAKIADGPLTAGEAAQLVKAVAEAVQYAHEKGVIHRDLKPANILLDEKEQPRVTDFGLAKRVSGESDLTDTGQVLGTPSYMPPEQAAGKLEQIGPAADVYALGALLYTLITGRPPFQTANPIDTLMQVLDQEPVAPSILNPKIRRDLETIALKCLEKDPRRRYASAQELADELDRFLNREPIVARPLGRVARTWRWCKRKPVLAGLWAVGAVLFLVLSIGGPWVALRQRQFADQQTAYAKTQEQLANKQTAYATSQRQLAEQQRDFAEKQSELRGEAEDARDAAREEAIRAYRNYYAAQMNLIQRDWEIPAIGSILERLDNVRSEGTGGRDLRGFEWHYWNRRCLGAAITVKGLGGWFTPDGAHIAVIADGALTIWNAATGQETAMRKGPTAHFIRSVSFNPDTGQIAFTCRDDKNVRVWDFAMEQEKPALSGHTTMARSVAYSPDGKLIASGSAEGTVRIWDAATAKEILVLKGHLSTVSSGGVTFSPDGSLIASLSEKGSVKVWNVAKSQETLLLNGGGSLCRRMGGFAVAFNPDGTQIASVSRETVRVWDTATGRVLQTLKGHTDWVNSVSFSPDGTRIASGSRDQTVRVWDTATGKVLQTLKGHTSPVDRVSFSPDGTQIASNGGGRVKVWSLAAGQGRVAIVLKGHHGAPVQSVSFSPDGKRIASGSWDETVIVWDIATRKKIFTLEGHSEPVASVSFSPDGTRIASGSWDKTVRVWDTETGQEMLVLSRHSGGVGAVSFSPDGTWIASCCSDGTVKLWDAATGRETVALRAPGRSGFGMSFSPDGLRIACRGAVWDVATGQKTLELPKNYQGGTSVSFSPNGERIVSCDGGKTPRVWDATTGQQVFPLKGHIDSVYGVSFSPDGTRVVSSSKRTVKVWDAATGVEMLTLERKARMNEVHNVTFSPDGSLIATGGFGTVTIWDAGPLQEAAAAAK